MGECDAHRSQQREQGADQEDPRLSEDGHGPQRDDRPRQDRTDPPGVHVQACGQPRPRDDLLEEGQSGPGYGRERPGAGHLDADQTHRRLDREQRQVVDHSQRAAGDDQQLRREAAAQPPHQEQGRDLQTGRRAQGDARPHHIEGEGLGDVDGHERGAVAFAACSSTKAATTTVTPRRPGTGPASGAGRSRDGAGAAGARDCSVVAAPMLSRAIIAIVPSTARSPKAPMMKVAIGGPATQATEKMARVLMIWPLVAPAWRRWANSSVLPTPAGPPSTTSAAMASGREVTRASTAARTTVSTALTIIGRRYWPVRSARAGMIVVAIRALALYSASAHPTSVVLAL